jgi:pilus assembly protein Flp/PilA
MSFRLYTATTVGRYKNDWASRPSFMRPTTMRWTTRLFTRFFRDDSGATAIEYGLIAAGISVVILLAVNSVGTTLNTTFTNVKNSLANAGK